MKSRLAYLALCAIVLGAAPLYAPAQTYPAKTVRLVVPFPAGGPADSLARLLGEKLKQSWGETVVVDNRGGAGSTLGTEIVAKAQPDGYTLLLGNISMAFNAALYRKLPYDVLRDLSGITLADLLYHRSGLPAFVPFFAPVMKHVPELLEVPRVQPPVEGSQAPAGPEALPVDPQLEDAARACMQRSGCRQQGRSRHPRCAADHRDVAVASLVRGVQA